MAAGGSAGSWGAAAAARSEAIVSRPLALTSPTASGHLFESLSPDRTGIDFVYRWNASPQYEKLLNSSAVGGGVCVGDYDGDGLPDLCLTRPAGGPRLYRNLGEFRFTNVTEQAGLRADDSWSTGPTFVDINNDGRLDLYLCCYDGPNRLYLNQGNGTFLEQGKAFGLDFNGASFLMAFGDYDRDGHLDGYLLTGALMPKPSQKFRVKFVEGRPVVLEELREFWQIIYLPGERAAVAEAGQLDHLYHNNGNGTFTEVSRPAGITGFDFGNAAVWWDYNTDGWPDLYVANDYFGPDHLYRNNRDGTFADVTRETLPHTPWTSMGADVADINNDGLIDLIASDMSGTTHYKRMVDMGDMEKSGWFLDLPEPRQYLRNAVYLNTGLGRFMEAAYLTGMANTDWTWSILFGDLDADGREDVFVPNGMTRDWMDNDRAKQAAALPPGEFARFWRSQPVRADANLAFRNLGDLQFNSVAEAWGLAHPGPSFGAALADLDGDGHLDLVVNDFEAPARVYRNCSRSAHRVTVRLNGTHGNRFGIGATIRIETGAGPQMRYVTPAHGFMSAAEPLTHFGLGARDRIDRLTVAWPDGCHQSFVDLPADQLHTITEPSTPAPVPSHPEPPTTLFIESKAFPPITHEEEPFDDFQRQPLLPRGLSRLGPGLAWSDVDGHGHDDLYVSGTRKKPAGLYLSDGQGSFRKAPDTGFPTGADEMAPLFFDADGDGDPDLYVVTGGVACAAGDESLRDRLYLNDGKGGYAPAASDRLPDLRVSGSSVVAVDLDRDGDLDLFVGGRSIPGQYPLTPNSHLLRNDSGRFTEVTDELAPGLRLAGLVTSAVASDADGDGWSDLLVTCEWGPVKLFHNTAGRLVDHTREAGLADRLGWWNGIAATDLDHDGDIDYVVTNFGLNTRYEATPQAPCRLYYGDFAGNGDPQIVEAILTRAGLIPVRGKTALERVIPKLKERFPTHQSFAAALLPDLLGAQELDAAYRLEVNTLESGVLLNDGKAGFAFHPLPRLAQIAPAFGVVASDFDGDGHPDLYLAQNCYRPQRETGRMDGGVGLLLLGRGDGTFEPVWPNRSGLSVPGDAKSATAADLNGDGWLDLVVGVNDGVLKAFENRGPKINRTLAVKLQGRPGNPTAAGARVVVHLNGGMKQTAEVHLGGGYLSQSGGPVHFGLGPAGQVERVEVRWPNGQSSRHKPAVGTAVIRIPQEEVGTGGRAGQ